MPVSTELITYIQGVTDRTDVLEWANSHLAKYLTKNELDTSEIEHVIDFLASDKAPARISRMSVVDAIRSTEKWNKTLQKKAEHIEESRKDTKVVLDFKDGFKFVRLIGKAAYDREGFLMRHCVASYFGKDVEVYSLRDKNNEPHCTVEKDKQIKGKGNGDIHPKYIDYVVRFLEFTGMNVRDSEMGHLGYSVVPFGGYTKTKLYRDRYGFRGSKIEYRDDVRIFESKTELKNYQGDEISLFIGDLVIDGREKLTHKSLTEVSGCVYVNANATFTAPKLTSSGYVYVKENATFTAPKLERVSGYVDVNANATFTAPKLTSSGCVYVNANATFTAPKLRR